MEVKYIISEIKNAVQGMREALEDPKGYGIVLQMVNYNYCCGKYYSYMDVLSETNSTEWLSIYDKYNNEVEELTRASDRIYRNLKTICGIDRR